MIRRILFVRTLVVRTLVVLLALSAVAVAVEGPHSSHPQRVVIIDNERIQPSAVTMKADEVLVFENQSLHPMRITFTEPAKSAEMVRCGLLTEAPNERPPWGLFDASEGKLTGSIPPGRFGSLCALQPGSYTFVAERQDAQGHADAELPTKGQVTVE
jgi:hypothetical protein